MVFRSNYILSVYLVQVNYEALSNQHPKRFRPDVLSTLIWVIDWIVCSWFSDAPLGNTTSLCGSELSIHFTLYLTSLDTIDNSVHALHFCLFINHNSHPILQASCAEIKLGIDEVTRTSRVTFTH